MACLRATTVFTSSEHIDLIWMLAQMAATGTVCAGGSRWKQKRWRRGENGVLAIHGSGGAQRDVQKQAGGVSSDAVKTQTKACTGVATRLNRTPCKLRAACLIGSMMGACRARKLLPE